MTKIKRQVGNIKLAAFNPEPDHAVGPVVEAELLEVEFKDLSDLPTGNALSTKLQSKELAQRILEMLQLLKGEESYFIVDSATHTAWILPENVFSAHFLESLQMLDFVAKEIDATKPLEPHTLVILRTAKELGKIGDIDKDESVVELVTKNLKGQNVANIVLVIWSVVSIATKSWSIGEIEGLLHN